MRVNLDCAHVSAQFAKKHWLSIGYPMPNYRISLVIRRRIFLPKQSQRSRSILEDGSRSLGLLWKGKTGIIGPVQAKVLLLRPQR